MYIESIPQKNKLMTQLVNGSISQWKCGVGKSILDILLNYSQEYFVSNVSTAWFFEL